MSAYEDIIGLPHHESRKHPHMPVHDRAAQFMPFAALSGYEDEITDAGRAAEEAADFLDRVTFDELESAQEEGFSVAKEDPPLV